MNTFYDVLGVDQEARADQIEQAYRLFVEFCMERDPLAADSTEYREQQSISADIQQAYAVLSAPAKRRAYDRKLVSQQLAREALDPSLLPWVAAVLVILVAIVCLTYYKVEASQANARRVVAQALKAQAEVAQLSRLADIEHSKLEQENLRVNMDIAREREQRLAQLRHEGRERGGTR
ncbi:MAG: DnaJ domain-containing protein [Pseudomonadota bacterium]